MPLFKTYLKVLKKNIVTVIIYFLVFIGITLILSRSGSPLQKTINTSKISVALFNNDNSDLSNDFTNYLDDYFYNKEMSIKKAKDALFYRDIYSIITIDENFSSTYAIKIEGIGNFSAQFYVDTVVNEYISYIHFFKELGLDNQEIVMNMQELRNGIKGRIEVKIVASNRIDYENTLVFINFSAYILMAGLLSLITIIMRSFKEFEINRRLDISKQSLTKKHGSLLLANFSFSILFLSLITLMGYLTNSNNQFDWLFILNMFVFTLLSLSLAYLVSMFFKSHKVLGSVSQVIALAPAFITGIFIPKALIDPNVLSFSRIFPYYWYVSANGAVTHADISNYFLNIGVMIGYMIVFILIAVLVSMRQRKSENA